RAALPRRRGGGPGGRLAALVAPGRGALRLRLGRPPPFRSRARSGADARARRRPRAGLHRLEHHARPAPAPRRPLAPGAHRGQRGLHRGAAGDLPEDPIMTTPASSHTSRHARALKVIPGGVNSPVRAFRSVGGSPVFIDSAHGAEIIDADGNAYIDFVLSWGPMILGHAHPAVIAAVQKAAEKGLSFGACTEGESEIAERICSILPSVEKVRLVCS